MSTSDFSKIEEAMRGGPIKQALAELPEKMQHRSDITEAGASAASAIAREYLTAADVIDKAGDAYLESQLQIKAVHYAAGDEAEKDGREIAARYHQSAAQYRQRGELIFKEMEEAAARSKRAVEICDDLNKNLE